MVDIVELGPHAPEASSILPIADPELLAKHGGRLPAPFPPPDRGEQLAEIVPVLQRDSVDTRCNIACRRLAQASPPARASTMRSCAPPSGEWPTSKVPR